MAVRYSLIVPVFNSGQHLTQVLPPLKALSRDWEVLVVDNGSHQDPRDLVGELLPRARMLYSRNGPARARNLGAKEARGEVFVFLDSDVLVEASVLEAMVGELEREQELDGLFGAYGIPPSAQTTVARFRNLYHRYVHQRCAGDLGSFWSGLGALRRYPFEAAEGFDALLFSQPTIEDVDLGGRLASLGFKVAVAPQFTAIHLKEWSLKSFFLTDVFFRAAPWTELVLSGRLPRNTMNTKVEFRFGPIFLLLTCLLTLWEPKVASSIFLLYLLWSLPLIFWMTKEGGAKAGLSAFPLLVFHHFCCLLGAFWGIYRKVFGRG